MMSSDNIAQFRQFLLELPRKYNYKYSKTATLHLRRALYFAFTDSGRFLPQFFGNYPQESIPRSWSQIQALSSVKEDWILHKLHKQHPAHPNVPCAKLFRKNESVYRCLTCGLDDSCGLCEDCFVEDQHIGHEVYISICTRDIGGVCDCGDAEAWVINNDCKHRKTPEVSEDDISQELKDSMFQTLACVVDYLVDILSVSAPQLLTTCSTSTIIDQSNSALLSSEKYGAVDVNSEKYFLVLYNDQSKHYTDAVDRIRIATMKVPEFAEMVAKQCHTTGRAIVLGSDNLEFLIQRKAILDATGLCSCIKSYREFFREEMCGEIINWMRDINMGPVAGNYRVCQKLLCKALCSKWDLGVEPVSDDLLGQFIPGRLQDNKIPIYPTIVGKLAHQTDIYWKSCTDDQTLEVERVWDAPKDICEECDYDPLRSSVNTDPIHGSRLQYLLIFDHRLWKSARVLLHEIYVSLVVSNHVYRSLVTCQYADVYPLIAEIFLVLDREFDWSFMSNLSVQLFTSPSHATMLSKHGEVKKLIAVTYGFLTTGHITFSNPNSSDLVHRKKPSVQLSSLKVRRWNQLFFDVGYILQRSETCDVFFQKDFVMQVCDLITLFNGLPITKRESVEHVEYETNDYPLYFNGVSIIAHFARSVVKCALKLENREKYVKASIFWILEKFILLLDESYLNDDTYNKDNETSDGSASKMLDRVDMCFRNTMGDVEVMGIKRQVLKFRVDRDVVCFLHPLSTYLSYLVEFCDMSDPEELRQIIQEAPKVEIRTSDHNSFTHTKEYHDQCEINRKIIWNIIIDYSLRTIVLLSQIKVGFWVRNGYSARSQYHNYRNLGLREYGFIRDIYLVQCFCVTEADHDTVSATIIERWGLIPWTNELYEDVEIYSTPQTLQFIVEEMLNFFIILFETNDHLLNLTDIEINEQRLIKDIVHYLCFEPLMYTELCSELPDHITNDRRFEYMLNKVADYVLPPGSTTNGRYKLKEEYMNEINPYYVHYTSNKRDDAEKLVRERQLENWKKKFQGEKFNDKLLYQDTYFEPKKIETVQFYQNLNSFTKSVFFLKFLKSTLNFILQNGKRSIQSSEVLINLVLHLIHVCIVNDNDDGFSKMCFTDLDDKLASGVPTEEPQSISGLLYLILSLKNNVKNKTGDSGNVQKTEFEIHQSKIKAIFKDMKVSDGDKEEYLRKSFEGFDPSVILSTIDKELEKEDTQRSDEDSVVLSEFERKKKMAAQRKAKILAAFKRQQSKFIEKNQNIIEDIKDHGHGNHDVDMKDGDEISEDTTFENSDDEGRPGWKFPEESCILCQMPAEGKEDIFGILTYVTDSSEFRNIPFDSKYWVYKAFSADVNLDEEISDPDYKHPRYHHPRYHQLQSAPATKVSLSKCEQYLKKVEKESVIGPGFPGNDSCSVMSHPITTSCGHGMHLSCFKNHLAATQKRVTHFTRTLPEDLTNGEFICPLCKAINNTLVPVLSYSNNISLSKFVERPSNDAWYKPFDNFSKNNIEKVLRSDYQQLVYDELKESSLETIQSRYKSLFFNESGESERFKNFHKRFRKLHEALCYITLSYFKENISTLLAHTIKSVEISLRGVSYDEGYKRLVIYQLSHRDITTLRIWSEYKKYFVMFNVKEEMTTANNEHALSSNASAILSSFNRENDLKSVIDDPMTIIEHYIGLLKLLASKEIFNIGNVDLFELLVSIIPLKCFNFSFNSVLTMCYLVEIFKNAFVLVTKLFTNKSMMLHEADISILDLPPLESITDTQANDATEIFKRLAHCVHNTDALNMNEFTDDTRFGKVFYTMMMKSIAPFLRRCAIWAFVNCSNDIDIVIDDSMNEPDKLCLFLNIDNFGTMLHKVVLKSTYEAEKFKGFIERMKLYSFLNVLTKPSLQIDYPARVELVNLPARMDFFYTEHVYPRITYDLTYDPAVCLFCGKVMELQESVVGFFKVGECNLHYETECINDCGLFLLPKHGSILLLHNGNGSFYDAPYYDQHGELLKDTRQGHPLHLNITKYREFIRNFWLQHNVANYVTRKLESCIDVGGWETL